MIRKHGKSLAAIALVALATVGGYWAGSRSVLSGSTADGASSVDHSENAAQPGKKPRKLLYYRNPMGLPDTSPTPKKDSMGMDYIAVYEGEDDAEPASSGRVKISPEKIQEMGVRTETVQRRELTRTVLSAGRVEPDERRIFAIAPKFEGYVERLRVNTTGQLVKKGEALFDVYSPELVSAQREYSIAAQGLDALKHADDAAQSGMRQLTQASLQRLRNWDISEGQIRNLSGSGKERRALSYLSPVSGVVTEKKAVQGMRFMPGETLYQIADLSSVWIIADVFEQDIASVGTGAPARIKINAYPDKTFEGKVTYVYPTLNAATRTVPVRIELANPGLQLKPAMFASVELPVASAAAALTVPLSAVIDSGTRQTVLVDLGKGRFEPRQVSLGARNADFVEIRDGVKEGEQVVVAANFLIDAESNLKAALSGFGNAGQEASGATRSPGHKGEGKVDDLDVKAGAVSLEHKPIASLNWPSMTMEFKLANESLFKDLKPGLEVKFEFVERQPGEWVITKIQPLTGSSHAGH